MFFGYTVIMIIPSEIKLPLPAPIQANSQLLMVSFISRLNQKSFKKTPFIMNDVISSPKDLKKMLGILKMVKRLVHMKCFYA